MQFYLLLGLSLIGLTFISSAGEAAEGRLSVIEENDSVVRTDKHYTQGMRLSYLSPELNRDGTLDSVFDNLNDYLPIFDGSNSKRKIEWTIVGQSIFTPTDIRSAAPSVKDRPYAAWLYTGASFLQETKHEDYNTLENAEILMGVVGPAALGSLTQNNFHQFVGVNSALGWKNELQNEPAFLLTYERKWRFELPVGNEHAIDFIPEAGFSGGNVMTYGMVGAMLRFGNNLGADYGPNRVRPALSGTAWFNSDHDDFGWYAYIGGQGRAVAHNIFLDGNIELSSASVSKKPFVADFTGGLAFFWGSSFKVDLSFTQRTKEFDGQRGDPDRFGSIGLALAL